MKLTEHFDTFLTEQVNLNQSRLDDLEARVAAVVGYLEGVAPLDTHLIRVVRQGSWEHRTIIKPQTGKEFDADIAILLSPIAKWEPKDYIDELYKAFRNHGTYREMVHRRTRCVTLSYAGDFHLDVAPIVDRGIVLVSQFAQNRITNEEERTAPEAYNGWLGRKNQYTQRNMLVKVTRLIKYLRDIKQTFSVPSILLTTLLGDRVDDRAILGDDAAECYPMSRHRW